MDGDPKENGGDQPRKPASPSVSRSDSDNDRSHHRERIATLYRNLANRIAGNPLAGEPEQVLDIGEDDNTEDGQSSSTGPEKSTPPSTPPSPSPSPEPVSASLESRQPTPTVTDATPHAEPGLLSMPMPSDPLRPVTPVEGDDDTEDGQSFTTACEPSSQSLMQRMYDIFGSITRRLRRLYWETIGLIILEEETKEGEKRHHTKRARRHRTRLLRKNVRKKQG